MVGNMSNRFLRSARQLLFATRDHESHFSLVDLDVDSVCRTEGHDLHVISVSTALGHLSQVCLENTVDLFLSWGSIAGRRGECSGILSLGVPSHATARVHVNELFVVVAVLPHVLNHTCTDFLVV